MPDEENKSFRSEAEAVIARQEKTVYRLAYSYLRNRADADDVYQEVFLRYFRRKPDLKSEEHERAWFVRATVNCCKNFCASGWVRRRASLEEGAQAAEEFYVPQEQSELFTAVMALPEKYRLVIHLFYYEGYSVREIAELLGEKPTNITTRLSRAREKLRDVLTGDEPEDEPVRDGAGTRPEMAGQKGKRQAAAGMLSLARAAGKGGSGV